MGFKAPLHILISDQTCVKQTLNSVACIWPYLLLISSNYLFVFLLLICISFDH